MKKNKLVSIIVPVYNRSYLVRKLLVSVLEQKYPKVETIIVDDASTDNTSEVAREYSARVYTRNHAERSVQRNFGAKKAKGSYFLFLDSDMELTENVLSECVKEIEKDDKIGGIIIPEKSVAKTFWERVKAFERSFYGIEGDESTDAARFFRREAFNEVGGYDENITGPEDWDLPESIKKQGYKIGRIKSRILHNEQIPNLFSLIKKKYYYAEKSHNYLNKQNISIISPKTIYFLRPVFYKNWMKLVSNPTLSLAMFFMFFAELFSGGIGYLVGKYIKR